MLFAIVPIGGNAFGHQLELAPWTWKHGRATDPGVYNNVYDDLDDSPVSAQSLVHAAPYRSACLFVAAVRHAGDR